MENADYSKVENCNFLYPSCYKRMLGIVDIEPEMTLITAGSSNCTVSRCAFRYTDGSAIETFGGNNTIENCYFYHIDYTVTDLSSCEKEAPLTLVISIGEYTFHSKSNDCSSVGLSVGEWVGSSVSIRRPSISHCCQFWLDFSTEAAKSGVQKQKICENNNTTQPLGSQSKDPP